MKQLNEYIIEKFKINSKTINNQQNILFNKLDSMIEKNENSVMFDDEELQKNYHITNMVISYNVKTNYIKLDHILIKDKNEGCGTKFMKDLCEWCDNNHKNLCLTPTNDFGSHLGRLKKFYKRFGFIENKGKYSDFTTKESMIRKPNK